MHQHISDQSPERPPLLPARPAAAHPSARPEAAQLLLQGGLYGFLLRDCLGLDERDARAIQRTYPHLTPERCHRLGYRSAPALARWRVWQIKGRDATAEELRAIEDKERERFDAMSEDEFLDWVTYSKERIENPLLKLPTRAVEYALHHSLAEDKLQKRFGLVSGIPGIYHDGERLRMKLQTRVIAPARVHGTARALYFYPRPGEARCYPVSSKGLPGGTPARHSIHVANEPCALSNRSALIAPHTIEADALANEHNVCAIAVNGLSAFRLVTEMHEVLPELKYVGLRRACDDGRLPRALVEAGYLVKIEEEDQS